MAEWRWCGLYFLLLSGAFASNAQNASSVSKPNIILIMTDDQGYGDFGFTGNPHVKTPHLDKLAARSTRLTNYHHSPVCAPTRASLLTGRYHPRTGVHDTYNNGAIMATEETTLAEILSANGYKTGIAGKWHLGEFSSYRPSDQGFHYSLIHRGGGGLGQPGDTIANFTRPDSCYFDPILYENNRPISTKGYCSDIFTDAAIRFVTENKANPFFLYLSFNAPHTPLQVPQHYYDLYKGLTFNAPLDLQADQPWAKMTDKDKEDARKVYAMATNIDDNVGRLLDELKKQGLENNSIIIFTTDNGNQQVRFNSGFRGLKGTVYEGGTRVPFLISEKGIIPQNKEISALLAHIDVLPTLLEATRIHLPEQLKVDGKSAWQVILGKKKAEERSFYNVWNRGFTEPYRNAAFYRGHYKLVASEADGNDIRSFGLFDILKDPYEKHNLVTTETDLALRLKKDLDSVFADVSSSPNLSPRRTHLGLPNENPVVLTRQDWAGTGTRNWMADEALGTWTVTVSNSGYYRFKLINPKPLKAATRALIRLGQIQRSKTLRAEASTVILDPVYLPKGDYDIESWYELDATITGPYYLEVTKQQ